MISIYDVLKASKGIHVDDTFANLWGRKLSNAYTVATYTGTLPTTLRTVEGYLESYKIYGNTVQDGTPTPENPIEPQECGERTENLCYAIVAGASIDAAGKIVAHNQYCLAIARVSQDMIVSCPEINTMYAWYATEPSIGSIAYNSTRYVTNLVNRTSPIDGYVAVRYYGRAVTNGMIVEGSTAPTEYIPYGYKLPLTANGVEYPIYLGDAQLAKDEYVDSNTGKIYRRTKNLSPPEEEWVDGQIGGGDGTVHPSTQIKVSPFIDVSTCETCIMEVFSAETEWAAAGYREMAFYDANKQYLGWIGGGGRQALTPNSSERLSEFPAGTVYVRISCSHGDQPFYPQLVSGYTPVHQFYPYRVPTDPPAPFPQIPTAAGETTISWAGEGLAPSEVDLTYRKPKGQ